ncbi:MAG: TonB-dependent receptor [Armatimonadota bacterium]|nr:TonB-dependent receptor [bacterium]
MTKHYLTLAFIIILAFAGTWAMAGTTGSVSGSVTDAATGEPLSGTNVIITGTDLSAITDAHGRYVIANIPPGDYEITAQMVGYRDEIADAVGIVMDTTASADFSMSQEAIAEEAVVVTRPKPMIDTNVVNTVNVLSANQEPLTRTDPANVRTAPGILSTMPGVNVESDGSGQMHLRGGKPDQIGWYVEGIPITDANSGVFSSDLITTGMSKFQVYTGAFGAEYGNAISGALNEVKKTGAVASGSNFITEGGSSAYGSLVGEYGGGTSDSFNYYVATSVLQSDLDSVYIKKLNYADNVVKLVWPSQKDTVTFFAMQGSQYGELENDHSMDIYGSPVSSENDFLRQRYAIGGLNLSRNLSPASFVSIQPYYVFYTSITNSFGGSIGDSAVDAWSSRIGIQAKYVNQLNAVHAFKLGGSVDKSNNNYHLAYNIGTYFPYYQADVDTVQTGLFAEDQMTLGKRATFTAGLRYDAMKYDRIGLAYDATTYDYTGDPVDDVTESTVNPRFGLSYALDGRSVLRTSWGKYSKFVPAYAAQSIYYTPAYEAYTSGIGSTDPQTSENYELSYEKQASDNTAWRVTYFNNDYENLSTYLLLDDGTYRLTNVGAGKSDGVELYVRRKMSDKWQGWLSYTYAKARTNRADIGITDQWYYAAWDQRHTISLVADYQNGGWAHSLRADYGSGRADYITDPPVNSWANPYIVFSYNMSVNLPESSNIGDSMYLSIYNIFNIHQTLQYAYSADRFRYTWVPSRTLSLGVSRAF